ncbi:MAG: hypothetical protein V3R17_06695 [Hyphomicrobium sp.]
MTTVRRTTAPAAAREDAEEFLREALANGPVPATQLQGEAKDLGIAQRTLDRAKGRVGVRSRRREGHWVWELKRTA